MYREKNQKRKEVLKKLYKKSIFVDSMEEVLNADDYFNRYDEWVIKEISIGYLMMALNSNEEIRDLLSEEDIEDLIYSIICRMDSEPFTAAIEESGKYDLAV